MWVPTRVEIDLSSAFFLDGVAGEFEFVSVVKKTVTNGIGDGGVANGGVPVRGWQLAGNDGGNGLMPGLDDFKEIATFKIAEGVDEEIIDNEELNFSEAVEKPEV